MTGALELTRPQFLTLAAIVDAEAVRIRKHKPDCFVVYRFLKSDAIDRSEIDLALSHLIKSKHIEARWYCPSIGYAALRLGRSLFPISIFDRPTSYKARRYARSIFMQADAA